MPDMYFDKAEMGDLDACTRVIYDSFKENADRYKVYIDTVRDPSHTRGILDSSIKDSHSIVLLAKMRAQSSPCKHSDEAFGVAVILCHNAPVFGLGPLGISPNVQSRGIGSQLMTEVLNVCHAHCEEGSKPSVRLVVDSFNVDAMALYIKSGFQCHTQLLAIQLRPSVFPVGLSAQVSKGELLVETMKEEHVAACCDLSKLAKIDRSKELPLKALCLDSKVVVDSTGVVGYSTGLNFGGHSVAKSLFVMQCLVAAQEEDCVFICPADEGELIQWILDTCRGRLVKTMCLMCWGGYETPSTSATCGGIYLPTCDY